MVEFQAFAGRLNAFSEEKEVREKLMFNNIRPQTTIFSSPEINLHEHLFCHAHRQGEVSNVPIPCQYAPSYFSKFVYFCLL